VRNWRRLIGQLDSGRDLGTEPESSLAHRDRRRRPRSARDHFMLRAQTNHAATPSAIAASPLIWPQDTPAAPAVADAVAAEVDRDAEALLAAALMALAEEAEEAEEAEAADALSRSQYIQWNRLQNTHVAEAEPDDALLLKLAICVSSSN